MELKGISMGQGSAFDEALFGFTDLVSLSVSLDASFDTCEPLRHLTLHKMMSCRFCSITNVRGQQIR